MPRKLLGQYVVACIVLFYPFSASANKLLEAFTIWTMDVEVRGLTETSLQLKADTHAYCIKIVPNQDGKVIFSLSGIGYATTAKLSNLRFGVAVTGYHGDELIYPSYSCDDINKDVLIENNRLIFERINGSIPIWFDQQVDSIVLKFSNSYALNVAQYLGIEDLHIVPTMNAITNPCISHCEKKDVMIAIDGSSSIDKDERGMIGEQLLDFVRKSGIERDSHTFCIVEFGSDLDAVVESAEKQALINALQKYKHDKNDRSKLVSWTNWSVVFEEALVRKPDILIFITDGWSNWDGERPASFTSQCEDLLLKTNLLKAHGTRLLFVTSDMDIQQNAQGVLSRFLNNEATHTMRGERLSGYTKLDDVDLVTMQGFSAIGQLDFASILGCDEEKEEVVKGSKGDISQN